MKKLLLTLGTVAAVAAPVASVVACGKTSTNTKLDADKQAALSALAHYVNLTDAQKKAATAKINAAKSNAEIEKIFQGLTGVTMQITGTTTTSENIVVPKLTAKHFDTAKEFNAGTLDKNSLQQTTDFKRNQFLIKGDSKIMDALLESTFEKNISDFLKDDKLFSEMAAELQFQDLNTPHPTISKEEESKIKAWQAVGAHMPKLINDTNSPTVVVKDGGLIIAKLIKSGDPQVKDSILFEINGTSLEDAKNFLKMVIKRFYSKYFFDLSKMPVQKVNEFKAGLKSESGRAYEGFKFTASMVNGYEVIAKALGIEIK